MATAIPSNLGEGGTGLTKGAVTVPTFADGLREAAADLAALKGASITAVVGSAVSPFAVTDIAAFTDPPSAAEMALLRTFVNALKTHVIALNARLEAQGVVIAALRTAQNTRNGLTTGLTAP